MFAPNYMNMQPMNGYGFNNITNNYGGYPFGYPPQIVNSGYNMYQQRNPYNNYGIPNTMNGTYYPTMQQMQEQQMLLQNGGYYDNNTNQFITNDKPLKSGPDNPLEQYRYIPGQNTGYVELEKSDGSKDKVYIPGGTITRPGGYNPATGMITQPMVRYPGLENMTNVPNYGMFNGSQYPIHMLPNGFGQNYFGNCVQGYSMNEFDNFLKEILYSDEPYKYSAFDGIEMLENIILTDAEREKINHNNNVSIIGTDYYGNPIYNNYYLANQQKQEIVEKIRNNEIEHYTRISKAVHAYDGKEFDEEKTRERFDPMRRYNQYQQTINQQMKPFNMYTATEKEKKEYFENIRIINTNNLVNQIENFDRQMEQFNRFRDMMRCKIKESHDIALGIKPGEHYNLSTFLTNAYKIGINNKMQELKSLKRNGKLKYNSNDYKNAISRKVNRNNFINNTPDIISTKDTEELTIESALRSAYDHNRSGMPIPLPDHGQSLMISLGDDNSKNNGIMYEAGKTQLNISAYNDNQLASRLEEVKQEFLKRMNENKIKAMGYTQ